MECGEYERRRAGLARGPGAVGLQLRPSRERGVPVARGARLPRRPARAAVEDPPLAARHSAPFLPLDDIPFMNDMDEISYWIYTKRAPCLMNYDNLIRKQSDGAQCSKTVTEEVSSPRKKKKKRKLSMLDEDSVSTEKHQNVYFEVPQKQIVPVLNTSKSESLGSDIDFNITTTTVRQKAKKARLQKNSRTRIHKKPKLVTSTPKAPVNLRRSLRQARQTGSKVLLNSSFEIYNTSVVSNGHVKNNISTCQKSTDKVNKSTQMYGAGDQTSENKRNTALRNKTKASGHLNGQFEDLSDVSGFTANYIRSTKVQSGKTPRKLRCKSSRNLAKESQQSSCREPQKPENMIICANKSMNTGMPSANMLNCSTDSSPNIINLITTRSHDKTGKLDKSTSQLKFVDPRAKGKELAMNKVDSKLKSKSNLNISYPSRSSATSRYPKRCKNHTNPKHDANARTEVANKNCLLYNNSDKKENPEVAVSRTRSGRNINLGTRQRENSVLVVSNSTEQVSSLVSMNVASPEPTDRKKRHPIRSKKLDNKSGQSLRRDSMREKSGFAACFSESDDDSVPLVQRKYFCN